MYIDLHVKYPLCLSEFNETRLFTTDFLNKTYTSNFMKILPLGAELFPAERRTAGYDDAFRNFVNAPKSE